MGEAEPSEVIEFEWGKKSARGGKNQGCQFYKSFKFDGLEYFLFDSIYLFKDDEPEPYIGKIIKIWEHYGKSRKVKVLWFFRPSEISNYIGDEEVAENELFLASGDGVGLTNINPLEAIAGKCNVVCVSKDARNIQPSDEDVQMADFIFHRTFDVQQRKIMDNMPEQIASTDIKFLLIQMPLQIPVGKVDASHSSGGLDDAPQEPSGGNVDDMGCAVESLLDQIPLQRPLGNVEEHAPQKSGVLEDDAPRELSGGTVDAMMNPSEQNLLKENPDANANRACSALEERPSKKAKLDNEFEMKSLKDNCRMEGTPSKKRKPVEKTRIVSDGPKETVARSQYQDQEVTRKPQVDKSKWFAEGYWEDKLRLAHQQGRLILLQNLDPAYTSAEVEDIVYQGFKESCKAKMIQQTAFSSPLLGQAFVIFNSRHTAEIVVKKLEEGCLLLSNARPLLGRIATPCLPEKKQPKLFGHLDIEKLRSQRGREMKDALSTSHCSQPNTIEYDMAMDWCLLRERSDLARKNLFKIQGSEMRKLMGKLKAKRSPRV